MKTHHIRLVAIVIAATLVTTCYAQSYPVKPLVVIVPLATASATDILMRVISTKMSESLGQQIAIENLPGAAGMLGGERVARAAPDGYTLGGFSDSVVNDRLINLAFEPATSTPEQLAVQTRSGYDKMAKVIKEAGIKAE